MSEPFLAEIRIVAFNFAPRGWAFCDGQILPISQNQSLYSLLGTTYGGDGRTSFALPDLRGRTPIHVGSSNGSSHLLGSKGGEETVTLSIAETPQHTHTPQGSATQVDSNDPTGRLLGMNAGLPYHSVGTLAPMNANTVTEIGGTAHNNMQPSLVLNFCIALRGLFPSRN
ncbi:MAG: phage tail protein [Ilumatobacter sp.]|nr:phage tail protein [Ilumatobacter sp.]